MLGAILNCEWIGEGVRDTCLMLAALCWVRYRTACGLEREGGHLFGVSRTVLGAI